jgi:hypothetical protein
MRSTPDNPRANREQRIPEVARIESLVWRKGLVRSALVACAAALLIGQSGVVRALPPTREENTRS